MRRILWLVLLAGGCAANAAQLEGEAQHYRRQASAAASVGDYDAAARAQARADELHGEAVERAVKEGRANDVAFVR